jgi:hypothetical protein
VGSSCFKNEKKKKKKKNSLAKHLGQLLSTKEQDKFALVLQEMTRRAGTSILFCRGKNEKKRKKAFGLTIVLGLELLDLEFVRKVGEEATILRENSLCTRFISLFTVAASKNFLKRLLTSFVMEGSVENPSEEWYRDRVAELCDALFDGSLMSSMPRSVRAVTAIIAEMAERYCPDRRYPLMAGYLFLRLVNPCLAAPQSYGLLPTEYVLPRAAQQNLLLISKVLQHLCNNTNYAQYPVLQKWIEQSQPRMEMFLDSVVLDECDNDPPFADQIPVGEAEQVLPSALDPVLLYDLLAMLSNHRSALMEVRSRLEKSGNDALVDVYDDLLAAIQEASPAVDDDSCYSTSGQLLSSESFVGEDFCDTLSSPAAAPYSANEPPTGVREVTRHSRSKKSVDLGLSRKSGLVGNMREKALKLMSFGGERSSAARASGLPLSASLSSQQLSASMPVVAAVNQAPSSSKNGLKESLLSRLNVEDPSLINNLTLFLLLRAMVSKKDGVATSGDRHAFQAVDAVNWLGERLNLPHRGNALMWLRMGQAVGALVRADGATGLEGKIQDDDSLFVVGVGLFRSWEAFVGKGDNPDLDVLVESVGSTCGKVLAQNPRGGGIEDLIKRNLEGLTGIAMRLFALCGGSNRCDVHLALDWIVLFGNISREHSIDIVRVLFKARICK